MAPRAGSETTVRPAAKPRYRRGSGPVWLSAGYRPFFLLAGLWALVVLPLSVAAIRGGVALPLAFDPVRWHFHELMFGYVAAALAGFLLTAVPNWTGRLPLQGVPLLGLVGLWGAGRLAMVASGAIGPAAAAAVDLLFLAVLLAVASREIIAGRNRRNLPMLAVLAAFLGANGLFHAVSADLLPADGLDQRAAIAAIALLVALIGGRITPSFTRNWLAKRGDTALPAAFGPLDRVTLLATLIALVAWTLEPEGSATAAAAAIAAALSVARLLRWQGHRVLGEPLLWVLHLGYLWVAAGLAFLAASAAGWGFSGIAAVHALTAGAMGTMTLGVMSRAVLGHGGHELRAGPALTAAFALVSLAAAARVAATLASALYDPLIYLAAAAWMAAFALFLLVCAPKLLTARSSG
ncbi:MAG TPA: NnrS family protein [Acidobacteriota bacterium]